jgi:hypothetical protein
MMKLIVNIFSITFTLILLVFILIVISYLTSINLFSMLYNFFEKQKENSLFPSNFLTSNSDNNNSSSSSKIEIKDFKGDVKPIQIYKTNIIPLNKEYYDILLSSVKKIHDKLVFSMDLAGDPNKNEKYETTYIWLLYHVASSKYNVNLESNSKSDIDQIYTLIIPNFAVDSNFNQKGWYMAVFNNTDNSYSLPLVKIKDMPKNKVQVFIDPLLIANLSSFNYLTSVMVRVNSTFLNKPPDYLMDSAPNADSFWQKWFNK